MLDPKVPPVLETVSGVSKTPAWNEMHCKKTHQLTSSRISARYKGQWKSPGKPAAHCFSFCVMASSKGDASNSPFRAVTLSEADVSSSPFRAAALSKGNAPNVHAYRGRQLLSQYHERYREIPHHKLSELKGALRNPAPSPDLPICIIGAGTAGLYTAMILESLGIDYQIVDAGTRDRIGGRLFTFCFPNGGPYDYYVCWTPVFSHRILTFCVQDVGAMRFPNTPFMKRVFDLAKNRKLSVKLIPYIMESPNTLLFYNNARVYNKDPSTTGDPFNISGYISDPNLRTPQDVSQMVALALQRFRDLFRPQPGEQPPDIAKAMIELFKETDEFSMRSYMSRILGMSDREISWCETLDKSTGWYDRALTESTSSNTLCGCLVVTWVYLGFTPAVIEGLAFNWPTAPLPGSEPPNPDPNGPWWCFEYVLAVSEGREHYSDALRSLPSGGSSTLPEAMFKSLSESAQGATQFQSPVTAISEDVQHHCMKISIHGTPNPKNYSAVISTVPLPRLSLMDLTGVSINDNYAQWSAIRELQYGPATKIGIKFSSPWWETLPRPIHGGQSFTDLPLRTM